MTWFLLALVAPFLYALTNFIDKILLEKYFKEGGVGTLILFSALLSVVALPFIFFGEWLQHGTSTIFAVDGFSILILSVVAILDIAILWFYLLALKGDEPSIIIVFYQLVPVFALGLGYLILGETLTQIQLIAMGIIIFGTTLVAFEFDNENNFKLRKKTVFYMTAAAFCWALESVLFKAVALEENVLRSLFWELLVLVLVGLLLFGFVSSYRKHFLNALKQNSSAILSLNVFNESLYMTGNIAVAFAVMLAPVSLILLGQSFQSFFVLIFGVLLTIFLPKLYKEKIEKRHVIQKMLAIFITGIGAYTLLAF
jgi:drug/metabolite transporter (DMT)-like permease